MEISLADLGVGKLAIIRRIEGGHGFQRRITSMGMRVGKEVRKVTAQPLGGPVVVEVEGCRTAIGRGMTAKIIVEEVSE